MANKYGRPPEYPWSRWFKRKRFKVIRGEDFNCEVPSMMTYIRLQAAKRDLRVSVHVKGNSITVERV